MRSRQIKSSASRPAAVLAIVAILAATGCDSAPTAPRQLDAEGVGPSLQMEENAGVPQQANLTFQKEAVAEGVWEGRVEGDIAGGLRTELEGLRISGPIWHVDFKWIITADDPADSLVFQASGTLNMSTPVQKWTEATV